jgi:hypothetical protein
MSFLDILCDGHGLVSSPWSRITGALSNIADGLCDTFDGFNNSNNVFSNVTDKTNGLCNGNTGNKLTTPELKLEDVVNEDNIKYMPKEAPEWWTANGGTFESWAVKKILEAELKEYNFDHSSTSEFSSNKCFWS